MFFFGKTDKKDKNEMKSWYNDRYMSVLIQRNFLILFTIIISLSMLICLLMIKNLQENKTMEPYLIEYDKSTGLTTLVDTTSKKDYIAQEAVKESLIFKYIQSREALRLTTIEEDTNYVRVNSHPEIYKNYLSEISTKLSELRKHNSDAKYKVDINSMYYLSSTQLEIKFDKKLMSGGEELELKKYKLYLNFGFSDLEASIQDMRLNPLGFQVTYYKIQEEKYFENDKENKT